jgi:Icc-related predicted phosphoesterase
MKILYVTDLHGVKWKYDQIIEVSLTEDVDIIINGGDMLPTRPNFFIQDQFILDFLDPYFNKINSHKIKYLFIAGNDDMSIHDDLLESIANKYPFIHSIQNKIYNINGFEFIGLDLVTDLPFGLKDRARMDTEDFEFPKQIGKPLKSSKDGVEKIDDWFAYAATLPTIEQELDRLEEPKNLKSSIYVLHMPPSNVSLDVCNDARRVGSDAIYEFIKKTQPLLTLHGHIHESPQMSNKWHNEIGNTICVQPGQSNYYEDFLVYVIIDLDTMNLERKILKN